ncbi:DUF397 domain-containing protein [Streptomyces sp. NPDC059567]|uniref:DUF397 domain-containing protein n=1 Tax=Streptomyces sp. NPDC059567 TaxID=3346867 RepID=UPI00368B572F
MAQNLYTVPIEGATFQNFCGGNLGGEHESCIDLAAIPGVADGFVLRDTKPEGAGHELRATTAEVDDFVLGYAKMRGLSLS